MRVMQMLDVSGANANSYDSGDLATGFTTTACNTLYLINMSDLCYQVVFTGGSGRPVTGHLPNNWARPFKVTGNYDRFRITGSNNPVGAGTAPFSHIVVESYYPDEDVSHLTDTAIPNPNTPEVNTSTAQYLVNSTDAPGGTVINVTPTGSTTQSLLVSNDGIFQLYDTINGQYLIVTNPGSPNGFPSVQLSDSTHQTEIKGNLLVDGTSQFTGNAAFSGGFSLSGTLDLTGVVSGNAITIGSQPISSNAANNLILNAPTGHDVQTRINNTMVERVTSTAIQCTQTIQSDHYQQYNAAADLTINNTNNANSILLEIAGTPLAQLQTTGFGLATPLSANNGASVANGLSVTSGNISNAGTLTQTSGSDTQILSPGTVVLNGGTSGTATAYQIFRGGYKYTLIKLSNFRTAGAAQQLTLPVAYTVAGTLYRATDIEPWSFANSGTPVTSSIRTVLPTSSAAGQFANGTTMYGWSDGQAGGAFAQIQFAASWTQAHNGTIVLEGS